MRPVNLLPDARRDASYRAQARARKKRIVALVVVGVLLLAAIVLGGEYFRARNDVKDNRAAVAAAQKELADVQAAAAAPSAAETALEARLAAATSASSARVQWDGLLADLALVLPKNAWLTSLVAQSPGAASASATVATPATGAAAATQVPTAFVIGGYALSHAAVAETLQRLALVPQLANVSLQQTQRAQVLDRNAIQFGIAADVRAPGGHG